MISAAVVDRIRALPREDRLALYRAIAPGTLASQRYSHAFWARAEQALPAPDDLRTIEVIRGGRGSGKTWVAVQLFSREIEAGRATRPRIVAATEGAIEATVINGPSGIRTWLPPHRQPTYVKTGSHAGVLTYPNGTRVVCLSAQRPGQSIGLGCDLTLADDPAGWIESCGEVIAEKTWKQVRVSNREGMSSIIVPTTKRGTSFLRRLMAGAMGGVRVTKIGGTSSNTNLPRNYQRDTIGDLEGDDWAAEELDDEDRDEAPGALWKRAWIDAHRVAALPELVRVVVAIDPSDDDKATSDEVGIVVVGLGTDGRLYVIADYTARHASDVWPAIAAWAFREHDADAIVVETNRGAGLVRRCLAIEAPHLPIVEVQASRGKHTRAEPLSLQYQDGRVSHLTSGVQLSRSGIIRITVQIFDPKTDKRGDRDLSFSRDSKGWVTLEDEICGWVPRQSRSPNGLDALVWACWFLCPPDGGAPWAPSSTPAIEGRYAGADPRRMTRHQQRRGG